MTSQHTKNTHQSTSKTKDSRSFFEKGLHWPLGLITLFIISGSFVVMTAVIGAGKGSRAVEPDYYARSINWDSEKERLQAADRLGWDIGVSVSPVLDPTGTRLVSIMLLDEQKNAIEGAMVEMTGFSQSNADQPITQGMTGAGAGQYQTRVDAMHQSGLWEFRVSIRHAGHDALVIKSLELKD